MKRLTIAMAVLVLNGCLGIGIGSAQTPPADTKGPNVSPEKGKEGNAASVSLLSQAGALVHYARENESPLAMLTAVQILERVHVKEAADKTKPETKKSGTDIKEGKKG